MNLTKMVRTLIETESITGNERWALEKLETILADMAIPFERQYVSANRWNILANVNSQTEVLYCTHVDTVAPFTPFSEDGDWLYGRGSCDAKGILAAMLSAGLALLREGHSPGFLFVVGEEVDSVGAKVAAASGLRVKYVVVGEPTDNVFVAAHKGALSYTLTCKGKAGHSSYPDRGESAVHTLLDILHDIRTDPRKGSNDIGLETINIGKVWGGVALNVIAEDAFALVMHRIVTDVDERATEIERIVGERAEIHYHARSQPQRLHVPQGRQSVTVPFGTDIPYLRPLGTPLLVGPGSIFDAHTDHERLSKKELQDAVALYKTLYHELAASS